MHMYMYMHVHVIYVGSLHKSHCVMLGRLYRIPCLQILPLYFNKQPVHYDPMYVINTLTHTYMYNSTSIYASQY